MQVDSWDEDVSEWARDETPIFGSEGSAQDWSDGLRNAAVAGYAVSVLATPSKARNAAVGVGAFAVTAGITEGLKVATSRERPNGIDDKSLPSGHAANAAVFNTLTVHNLQAIDMGSRLRTSLEIGAGAVTVGTAWARVESGDHYPSDVLVGMALGNFMGAFFAQTFLGLEPDARLAFGAEPVAAAPCCTGRCASSADSVGMPALRHAFSATSTSSSIFFASPNSIRLFSL